MWLDANRSSPMMACMKYVARFGRTLNRCMATNSSICDYARPRPLLFARLMAACRYLCLSANGKSVDGQVRQKKSKHRSTAMAGGVLRSCLALDVSYLERDYVRMSPVARCSWLMLMIGATRVRFTRVASARRQAFSRPDRGQLQNPQPTRRRGLRRLGFLGLCSLACCMIRMCAWAN